MNIATNRGTIYSRIPRKLKKQFKRTLLRRINAGWKSRELLIRELTRDYRHANKRPSHGVVWPTLGNLSLTGFELGK